MQEGESAENGGKGGVAAPIGTRAAPSAGPSSPANIAPHRLAPQPDRLMPHFKNALKTNALQSNFQHHHSNTRHRPPRKRRKSAILALLSRSSRAGAGRPAGAADRAPRDRPPGRNAESFARPPPHHSAGQHLARDAIISTRQNIPGAGPICPDPAAETGRLHAQPWRNRNATNKYWIFICNVMWLQSCNLSRVCARVCALAYTRTRMTRGERVQPRNHHGNHSKNNML